MKGKKKRRTVETIDLIVTKQSIITEERILIQFYGYNVRCIWRNSAHGCYDGEDPVFGRERTRHELGPPTPREGKQLSNNAGNLDEGIPKEDLVEE